MNEVEWRHIRETAAGLDRLVPRIAAVMRKVERPADFQRLSDLLKPAERFLIDAGAIMSRAKPDEPELRETVDRFMRELPRRLRMVREAQAVPPPMSRGQYFARTG